MQVLRDTDLGDQAPGARRGRARCSSRWPCTAWSTSSARRSSCRPTNYRVARRTDAAPAPTRCGPCGASTCSQKSDGTLLALFESQYWLERLELDHPELVLERLVAEGSAG